MQTIFLLPDRFFLSEAYFWGMAGWVVAGIVVLVVLVKLRRRASEKWKRWVHAGLSAWIVAGLLTTVELYYAVLYDTTDSFSMTNVSKRWFSRYIKPFERELRFSSQRAILFRDDHDMPTRLGEGRQHVVFVGDSFTFGHGVRRIGDRFTNRLGLSLEIAQPKRYTVTNLSNTGVDLDWIHRLLILLFEKGYPVDRVVYVICLNDIETFHPRHRTYYQDLAKHAPTFFLWRDTYFFNLMYFRLRQFGVPDVQNYYAFVREYYDGSPWTRMQERLDEMADLCREHEARLQIVVFPFLHNLGDDYPFREAHEQFAAYGESRKIDVLDLLGTLEPNADKGLTVNSYDAHPNETTHALVADAIEKGLFADD